MIENIVKKKTKINTMISFTLQSQNIIKLKKKNQILNILNVVDILKEHSNIPHAYIIRLYLCAHRSRK